MLPRLKLPPPPAVLALFAAVFILPGLAVHDPWKSWDALGIGVMHSMSITGEVQVPRVAGSPWMHDPPLYHWFGALLGRVLQSLIEFHAGARLASGIFVGAAFLFIYHAARQWAGAERAPVAGAAALLLLLGAVGLMVHSHEALPELGQLAAMCGALAALAQAGARPVAAGTGFGVALGLGFLAAGWIAPISMWLAAAAAHAAYAPWRTRAALVVLALGAALALALAAAWLLPLAYLAPGAFLDWWQLAGQTHTVTGRLAAGLLATVGWFAWPVWPLALWALWSQRREWREPRLLLPALAALFIMAAQLRWGPAQQENLLPVLAPLALLGAQGIFTLRRGAAGALDWFGVLVFAFFTGLVWLGYVAMMTGFPPRVDYNFARAAPGFVPQFAPLALAGALLLAAGWLYVVFLAAPSPMRSVARWAAGIVLLWGTFSLLWMPWVDYQKSYRSVALQLRQKVPVGSGCVASRYLGLPQAAALDYHAAIRTQPFDLLKPAACRLVLVQGSPQHELDAPSAPGMRWSKVADVGRPGDRAERLRLYQLNR
ncbi:MAG: ArnT family glycosyltransferase [Betaproteobacteria bacterium]